MIRSRTVRWFLLSFLLSLLASPAIAETIELVTYYPTSSNQGDLHAKSLTVGTAYNGVTPLDGTAIISGQLGIGTTNPIALFQVGSSGLFVLEDQGGNMELGGSNTTANPVLNGKPYLDFHFGTGAAQDYNARIINSGNNLLEILTNNGGRLALIGDQVQVGNTTLGSASVFLQTDQGGSMSLGGSSTTANPVLRGTPYLDFHFGTGAVQGYNARIINSEDNRLLLQTAAGGMLALNGGYVGIGTDNPIVSLDLRGQMALQDGNNAAVIVFRKTGTNPGFFLRSSDNYPVSYQERLYIRGSDGFVGIGTVAPIVDLDLRGQMALQDGNNAAVIVFRKTGPNPGLFLRSSDNYPVNYQDRLYIRGSDGFVGIGTAAPQQMLHVAGNACKPGGGAWASLSDLRLKTNVYPLKDALTDLLRLRGVTFEWKDPQKLGERAGIHRGMVGQEVEKVFPEWVTITANGYRYLCPEGFEALTVEAVRELKQENGQLRQELQLIKQDLAALKGEKGVTSSGR